MRIAALKMMAAVCAVSLAITGCSREEQVEPPDNAVIEMEIPVQEVMNYAAGQLEKSVEQVGDPELYPSYTRENGTWETTGGDFWSSGFFAGCLWQMYDYTGNERFADWGRLWTISLEEETHSTLDADIGYRIVNSYNNAWRLTDRVEYREGVIDAARSMATRYDPRVGAVKGYDGDTWTFPLLIDHMMNIELLFLGATYAENPEWRDMAVNHAHATMEYCIRDDDSTIQVVDIDPETGEVIAHDTICGLSGDSSWARGHAEGLYGFAIAYRESGEQVFLDTAMRLADYFIAHLPPDFVPYWDFADPAIPDTIRDSSAASMAADGLFELSSLLPEGPEKEKYYNAAVHITSSLCENYLTRGTSSPGILDNATWKTPDDPGADTSLIWGDCNFISALMKYAETVD